jgi:hypothetical protein
MYTRHKSAYPYLSFKLITPVTTDSYFVPEYLNLATKVHKEQI